MFAVKSQAASIGQEMWCTQSLLESSVELTNTRCGSGYVLTLFDKVKVVGEKLVYHLKWFLPCLTFEEMELQLVRAVDIVEVTLEKSKFNGPVTASCISQEC